MRAYEKLERHAGETVHAFIRRYGCTERRLRLEGEAQYPDEVRAIKLLDGCKLDERSVQVLLSSIGNVYDLKLVKAALCLLYPPGRSITGQNLKSAAGVPSRGGGKAGGKGKYGRGGQRARGVWLADAEERNSSHPVNMER